MLLLSGLSGDIGFARSARLRRLDSSFQPEALAAAPEAPAAQISVLAVILAVGLILFLIDAADRSYWDRQEA